MLALTLYKVLQFHSGIPKQSRSRLLDAFWIDGTVSRSLLTLAGLADTHSSSGVINFTFMLREFLYISPRPILEYNAYSSWNSEHWVGA